MVIGKHHIQPVLLYLPDEEKWLKEFEEAKAYFAAQGLTDIECIAGIHAHKWGVTGTHIYLLDGRPEEQFQIGQSKTGGFLSHYLLYNVMKYMPVGPRVTGTGVNGANTRMSMLNEEDIFMVLEGDCRFTTVNWKEILADALNALPANWDFLFIGSCCALNKEPVPVAGDVYHYPWRGAEKWDWYPQGGWCYLVKRRCMDLLIKTQRDAGVPVDISLIRYAFPEMKVYAILPRLADQGSKTLVIP